MRLDDLLNLRLLLLEQRVCRRQLASQNFDLALENFAFSVFRFQVAGSHLVSLLSRDGQLLLGFLFQSSDNLVPLLELLSQFCDLLLVIIFTTASPHHARHRCPSLTLALSAGYLLLEYGIL